MEHLPKTKKPRLVADFTLNHTLVDWKFHIYKGTTWYDMMCVSQEGDVLNGNRIINLKNLIDNIRRGKKRKKLH